LHLGGSEFEIDDEFHAIKYRGFMAIVQL
jgi:hypothetical protein